MGYREPLTAQECLKKMFFSIRSLWPLRFITSNSAIEPIREIKWTAVALL